MRKDHNKIGHLAFDRACMIVIKMINFQIKRELNEMLKKNHKFISRV